MQMRYIVKRTILLSLTVLCCLSVNAQVTADLQNPLPQDSRVKSGKLKNGLTYYVMENQKPEKRVELRLVVNAGSVLENDDQLGLAHFTEHMAFNGTKNFKKNELVDYLQSVGVKFGAHLNAYTSFDETVYILPIPSDDEAIVDQGLQILRDWSADLSFDAKEIDKERGVVIEEWRLGQGASRRMLDQYLPVIFKNSLYAERLPIGTKEVLETFDHKTIKEFYTDWYRPDLMAVVAVGDIDSDEMIFKIKEKFGDLKNPRRSRERIIATVPNHEDTYVSIVTDKEASFITVNIMYQSDPKAIRTEGDYRKSLISGLFSGMLNQRLAELQQQAEPPFILATSSTGASFARTKSAFSVYGIMNENRVLEGSHAMLEELRRVELHGFVASELQRQKLRLGKAYENAYNERDKTESSDIVNELVNNFLEEEAVPGIEFEYAFVRQYLSGITLDEVNAVIKKLIHEDNRVAILTGPEKEGVSYPSEEELLAKISEVSASNPDPYVEEVIATELVKNLPPRGKVVDQRTIDMLGVDVVRLSNGVEVFLKATDFKNDEIRMAAHSPGGHSLASDEDYQSASNASDIVSASGIGDFSATNLKKALAGKSAVVGPYIGELEEGLSGGCTPEDLEVMLQLTYLYLTSVRRDQEAFQSFMNRNKSVLSNIMADPGYYFSDKMQRFMTGDHKRGDRIPTIEDMDDINLDKALAFYEQQFSKIDDFTFWFVGSFDKAELIPLLEKYIGSIPPLGIKDKWVDLGIRPPSGNVEKIVKKGTDPKSSVVLTFTDQFDYKRQDAYYLQALSEVLDIKLVEILREEKSGVYGVGASSSAQKAPYEHYSMTISFPCAPENVEELTQSAIDIVKDIQTNGVSQENLDKIKEAQRRSSELNKKRNGFWLAVLNAYHIYGWEYTSLDYYEERIDALKAEDIQEVAKKYLDTDNFIKIVHYPED